MDTSRPKPLAVGSKFDSFRSKAKKSLVSSFENLIRVGTGT